MVRKSFGPSGQVYQVIDDTDTVSGAPIEETDDADPGAVDNGTIADASRIDDDGNIRSESTSPNAFRQVGDTFGGGYTDPAGAVSPKRPRKKRGPNRPKPDTAAQAAFITSNLEKVLYGLHTTAAAILREPDIEITQNDAALLAEAVREVAAAYNFTKMFDPKVQAWIDLTLACGTVYGPKVAVRLWKQPKAPTIIRPISQTPPSRQPESVGAD